MLGDECGKAPNVQNRRNRQSELAAIASAQQTLKLYSHKPDRLPNGLVLFTGKVVTGNGTVQKTTLCFQPFRPNHASFSLCDNKFHTEPLTELVDLSTKLGFIVMDATGALFGTVRGEPTVSGLILAGAAALNPSLLSQLDTFDPRLQSKVVFEVGGLSSSGDAGLLQAIERSGEALRDATLIHETELIGKYFDEIDQDSGKFVYGVVENVRTGETVVKYLSRDQETSVSNFRDEKTKAMLVIHEEVSLVEWLKEEYKQFGCSLELVTNKSRNGAKFCGSFGCIGGILRYSVDMLMFDES